MQASPTVYAWTKVTNVAPTFAWVEPDGGDRAISPGIWFTLKWEDADPDDNALITVYFGDTFMSRFIGLVDEDPDGTSDELVWDTTGVDPGIYFVCAHLIDSRTTRTVWSTHPIIIGTPAAAPWNWQPESLVGVGTVRSQTYQVAIDEFGHAMAVGTYTDDRGWVLNYSVYDGAAWGEFHSCRSYAAVSNGVAKALFSRTCQRFDL